MNWVCPSLFKEYITYTLRTNSSFHCWSSSQRDWEPIWVSFVWTSESSLNLISPFYWISTERWLRWWNTMEWAIFSESVLSGIIELVICRLISLSIGLCNPVQIAMKLVAKTLRAMTQVGVWQWYRWSDPLLREDKIVLHLIHWQPEGTTLIQWYRFVMVWYKCIWQWNRIVWTGADMSHFMYLHGVVVLREPGGVNHVYRR